MNSRFLTCVAFITGSLIAGAEAHATDWPQFRGPGGNATSYDVQTPVFWDDSKNVAWKTPLPGRGASSAIVFGDRIFLTAYTGYGVGEEPGEKADLKLHMLCLKRSTGEILWDELIDPSAATQNFGNRVADHGYATGTPATDGQHVYAYFGVSGLVAFDMDGKLKWRKETGTETAGFGSASSPVIHEDLVYVNASIESGTLFAFNKVTGEEVWKVSPIKGRRRN